MDNGMRMQQSKLNVRMMAQQLPLLQTQQLPVSNISATRIMLMLVHLHLQILKKTHFATTYMRKAYFVSSLNFHTKVPFLSSLLGHIQKSAPTVLES